MRQEPSTHVRKAGEGSFVPDVTWKQHFRRGYIHQAFDRACIKERIGHGAENEPYLQRADWKRLRSGKTEKKYDRKKSEGETDEQPRSLKSMMVGAV